MSDETTRIEKLRYITYYPAKGDKKSGFMLKGNTAGERVKAWVGPKALDGIKDRLSKGDKNEWGGQNYTTIGEFGVNASFKKVTILEQVATGKSAPRGGKVVTFDSLQDLMLACANTGQGIATEAHPDSDENTTNEIAQKYATSLFIAGIDAGLAHVNPEEPEEKGDLFEKSVAQEADEEEDSLPF
jgi:hypothetical protein